MATEPIQFELDVSGDERVARAFTDLEQRLRRLETAERGAARSAEDMGRANATAANSANTLGQNAQRSQVNLSQFSGVLGIASQGLGRFSQGAGQMGQVLQAGLGAVGALTAGLGPLGLGIAAVTAAFGLMSSGMQNTRSTMDEMSGRIRATLLPTLSELASSLGRVAAAQEQVARTRAGRGSAVEQAAQTELLRRRAAQRQLTRRGRISASDAPVFIPGVGLVGDTEQQEIEASEGAAQFAAREDAAFREAQKRKERSSRRRTGRRTQRQVPAALRNISPGDPGNAIVASRQNTDRDIAALLGEGGGVGSERAVATEILGGDMGATGEGLNAGLILETGGANARLGQQLSSDAESAAQQFRDAWVGGVDDVVSAWGRANRAASLAGEEQQSASDLMIQSARAAGDEIVSALGEDATEALQSSVAAWLDGSKSFGQAAKEMAMSVIQALVAESIVQAAVNTAKGVAALASVVTAPTAPGFFAAAATWAGVGVVAGTVGLATGAVGKPASGGGGAGSSRRPEPRMSSGDEGGGGKTIIINMGDSKVLMGSKAEIGRAIGEAVATATQRYG